MSEPIIGSIGVAVVPNAERFWEDFKAKTAAGAENAAPTVKVKADVSEVERKLAEVKASAAIADTTVRVNADTSKATFQMHLLADAIATIGPAAVPIAGVLSGALLGLGPAAGAAVVGLTGISNEMKSGALIGTQFGVTLNDLGNQFQGLQHTAADGLLSGLQQSLGTLNPLIGLLNTQIGFAAKQIGTAFAASLPGILSVLRQLNPLFTVFGNLLVSSAQSFTKWAQSTTGVTQFVNYVKAELPAVGHFIGQLITLVGHLVESFAPLGASVLSGLNVLIAVLNSIPINVLQTLVPLATAGYVAFRAYSGLSVVAAAVNTFSAAVKGLGTVTTESAIAARVAEITETSAAKAKTRAITVAAQAQIAAGRAVAAAAEAEAAAVAAASETEQAAAAQRAAFFTATNSEFAASSAALIAAKEAEAAAVAAASAAEATSVEASALVVTATAEAEAASIQAAGEKAAAGWLGFLPIVGAVAIGISLFTSALGGNSDAARKAAEAEQTYAQSVKTSTDALNAANVAQTNDNLAKSGAFRNLDQLHTSNLALGLSYKDLTTAVNGTNGQFNDTLKSLAPLAGGFGKSGKAAFELFGTLLQYRSGLQGAIQTQTELNSANAASLGITDQQASKGAALYGLVGDKGVAAYLSAKAAAQQLTDQTLQQMAAFQEENNAAGILQLTLDKLSGKNLSYAEAENAFEQQLVNMVKHTSKADSALVGFSSSAIKNRGDLNNLVQTAQQAAEAYGNMAGSSEAGRQKLITLRKQIIDNAVAHGEDRKQVTAYVNSILTIPKSVPPTKLEVDKAAAEAALATFKANVASTQGKTIRIDTIINDGGLPSFAATIERLSGSAGVTVSYGRGNATAQTKADGGYITGPGTGTSDSIPAMLSNGEFVINAAQTAKHRDLLNAINKGVQGFASGGVAGDIVTLTPSTKSSSGRSSGSKTDSISISADGGAAYAIAEVIRGNIPEVRRATADLSQAVNDAFQLKGVQAKLAAVSAQLKNMQQASDSLRSGVQSTLSGSVDVSKYADVGGLLDALGNQTGANDKFTSELNKLSKEGVNKTLLGRLAAAGPSAGLDSLAGASAAQIKQVNSAFGSYITSATAGGNFAAADVYGSQIAADQKMVSSLIGKQNSLISGIDKLVSVVAKMTGRPVEVKLDGKVVAQAVFKSKEFDGVLDELHHLVDR